jgi:hypothetical protein
MLKPENLSGYATYQALELKLVSGPGLDGG